MPRPVRPLPASSPGAALPTSMSALTTRRYGRADVLAQAVVPVPRPGRRQVLVRVAASSVNPLDWHLLTGTPYLVRLVHGLTRPRRRIPGADVAGIVVTSGRGVEHVRVGDAVLGQSAGGAFAELVAVDAADVVPLAHGVDLVAAGATPVAGLTALQALRTHARVGPGDRVLVNGAGGGVGGFAVQLARILGAAEVVAVCSAPNAARVDALGATGVIDYRRTDFTTTGAQYDVVLDMVGNRSAAEVLRVLAPGGRYVAVSGPKDNRWLGPVPHLVRSRRGFRRSGRTFHQFTAAPRAEDLAFLAAPRSAGGLVRAVDRYVGLGGVPAALERIATGHSRGKIVVLPDGAAADLDHRAPGQGTR